jgi:hypothetical protein
MNGPRARKIDVVVDVNSVEFDGAVMRRPATWSIGDWRDFWLDVAHDRSYARGYAEGRQDGRDEMRRTYDAEALS